MQESAHCHLVNNHFILCRSRSTLFMLQSSLQGMCDCMYLTGYHSIMPDDGALHFGKGWDRFSFFATRPCGFVFCFFCGAAVPASVKWARRLLNMASSSKEQSHPARILPTNATEWDGLFKACGVGGNLADRGLLAVSGSSCLLCSVLGFAQTASENGLQKI